MVLTRSRAASPASAAAGASSANVVPPLLLPVDSAPESTPRDLEAAPAPPSAVSSDSDAVIEDQGHALPLPPAANPAAASITMTTEQLLLLINRLSPAVPVSTATHISGNFAKCSTRFDGLKTSDVLAFIDAIEVYKSCVNMSDDVALRGLPMLLTGLAATWWQGVKDSTPTWQAALESLRQTFGPRLPVHRIF
ncbi:activity-regulated cytoskeleton associated protein 2-like [Papilio machaon]|uniref:activity-regulated cytoskeleton associated protein 2-like n=1 Tax=Papilio machaon TaxID=76193 RepID=UPI001E665D64|nr:activity-regulated cytoskeleton associated protein 2-like [Papilio machaon]